ncbi:MAG: hypothetical protein HOO06_13220 [Bdellovibrionaceae bacterium]|jgi:hypothetical protein|nr:hypothetical protein [Pseudobdellovibrionaceae bacterium]
MKSVVLLLTMVCSLAYAEETRLYLDTFSYEEPIYSQGRKSELGDEVRLDISAKYLFTKDTSLSFRFETSPEENRFKNKTSKFEWRIQHSYEHLSLSADLELQTSDYDNGGTSLGFDLDSDKTYISWKASDSLSVEFYPYNFGGNVGRTFDTYDVTRLFFVSGAPTTMDGTQGTDLKVISKTIPGFLFQFGSEERILTYIAFGAASFDYPANPTFDLQNNATSLVWERHEDFGGKAGVSFSRKNIYGSFDIVHHNNSEETGALIESAGSAYLISQFSNMVVEAELTATSAGQQPWRLSSTSNWFEKTTTFEPYYWDDNGDTQKWVGKTDAALMLTLGIRLSETSTPYISLKHQGENFIFSDPTSAELLRTNFERESHGGLTRLSIGSVIKYGKFKIRPDFEYRKAKNKVFTNANDLRSNNNLSQFDDTDIQLRLYFDYSFDETGVLSL